MVFEFIDYKSDKFNVYYLPLEMNLYVPPSREDIMKNGIKFEIDSFLIKELFEMIYNMKGVKLLQKDYTGLRIMIVNKKNNDEIFITVDKVLLSISKKKKYIIKTQFTDKILKELTNYYSYN